MKPFLFNVALSTLVCINFANAFECPDVAKDPENGNIVNLSEVDIPDNNVLSAYGSVACVYNYISSNSHTQKTFTFNYTEHYYVPLNSNNWDITSNYLKCKSENPADCQFNQEITNFVAPLQRCPDTLTEPGGSVDNFQFGRYKSPGEVGVTQCVYTNANNQFEYYGLYFDSTVYYSGPTWTHKNQGGISCSQNGDDYYMNPDQCEFYLAD